MGKYRRAMLAFVVALLALATLSACAEDPAQAPGGTSDGRAGFPQSAAYVADMEKDGKKMTIGITVDGADVTAYACNGSTDEAWFFGGQSDGRIDLTSRFRDTLTASYDGIHVDGDLTMDGVTHRFTAAPVEAPAGIYTADSDGTRAAWILRPDGSSIGVQFSGISGRDFEQAELQQLKDEVFRTEVRNKRRLQQAQQIVRLQNGGMESTINGRKVTPVRVRGAFRI
jgi:hypothetical protein